MVTYPSKRHLAGEAVPPLQQGLSSLRKGGRGAWICQSGDPGLRGWRPTRPPIDSWGCRSRAEWAGRVGPGRRQRQIVGRMRQGCAREALFLPRVCKKRLGLAYPVAYLGYLLCTSFFGALLPTSISFLHERAAGQC